MTKVHAEKSRMPLRPRAPAVETWEPSKAEKDPMTTIDVADELSLVRWKLEQMVEQRLATPFSVDGAARYSRLVKREKALLRGRRYCQP